MTEDIRPWIHGDQDSRWDGYFNEHRLLTNLSEPQVTTQAELDAFEKAHSTVAAIELRLNPPAGNFDLQHLRTIHHALARKVYPWAGDLRTVDISKGSRLDADGNHVLAGFLPHQHIVTYMGEVAATLRQDNYLVGLSSDVFAHRLAQYFNAVNFAHPFREMNGRTSREFWTQLANQAGHAIHWKDIAVEENIVISHRARTVGDLEPLREALKRVTVPLPDTAATVGRLASLGYAAPVAAATSSSSVRRPAAVHGDARESVVVER